MFKQILAPLASIVMSRGDMGFCHVMTGAYGYWNSTYMYERVTEVTYAS